MLGTMQDANIYQELLLQKVYRKALNCDREFTSILAWKFSLEMRNCSLTKVLYSPGGTSVPIQDGDISQYVLMSTMHTLKMVFLRLECFL